MYTTKNAFFVSGNHQTIGTNEHADTCVRPGSSGFLEPAPDAARPEIPPSRVSSPPAELSDGLSRLYESKTCLKHVSIASQVLAH